MENLSTSPIWDAANCIESTKLSQVSTCINIEQKTNILKHAWISPEHWSWSEMWYL
jgi:hypothetical protein